MLIGRGWAAVRVVFRFTPIPAAVFVMLSFASAIFTPLQILFLQRLVDRVSVYLSGSADTGPLVQYGGLLIASVFGVNLFSHLYGIMGMKIGAGLTKRLSPDILAKFRRLDYPVFEDASFQDIMRRMSSDPQGTIHNAFQCLVSSLHAIIAVAGIVYMFFGASLWLGIGAACIAVPMYALEYRAMHMQRELWYKVTSDQRKAEYVQGLFIDRHAVYEAKVFGSVRYLMSRFDEAIRRIFVNYTRTTGRSIALSATSTLLMLSYIVYAIANLSTAFVAGAISLGVYVSLISSIGRFYEVMSSSVHVISSYVSLAYDMRYYIEFMALPERKTDCGGVEIGEPVIEFRDVCFTYPGTQREVLHNLNLTIRPGQRVAFVGENGAGKSTIVKLLCGLYEPESGSITIGGVPLSRISEAQRRRIFSIVFQDFQSYQLTLRENIAFGDIGLLHDDEALVAALEEAGGGELLGKSPKGLDMSLGRLEDDGTDLSKGQWQRIATARAFLSGADFAILDEPTASLDPIVEGRMYEAFARMFRNKGAIMISHRLASAKMADKIIVIDGGEAVEQGSHEALMAMGGLYCTMYEAQSSWYQTDTQGDWDGGGERYA